MDFSGVPDMWSPAAYYRGVRQIIEGNHARTSATSGIPSSIDPNQAAAYWHFLSVGKNLDVRM